jgi:hypothetical protein
MASARLQAAVYQHLLRDTAVAGLVGGEIFDAPLPRGASTATLDHITLGEETVRSNDTKTSRGAVHEFLVTVHSQREGFDTAKRVAAAICESLVEAPLVLEEGTLVDLRFVQARAERARAPEKRKVSLRFRAIVDQDS